MMRAVNSDLRGTLKKTAELGFRGVNWSHANSPEFQALPLAQKRALVYDSPRELGLTITALACNISQAVEGDVEQRMSGLRDAIDLAQACEIPIVIVHGGERCTENEVENQAAWQRLIENLGHGIRYGQERGVQVAMEPGGGVWMVHGWRLLARLREELGEGFKVNLDPANVVMVLEDPVEGVRVLKDAIVHVHIKDARIVSPAPHAKAFVEALDNRASGIHFAGWVAATQKDRPARGSFWRETPAGEGDVDFAGLVQALAGIGFDGWMAIEREGREVALKDILQARDHVAALL
jgi:sugar phosphate isomerase/epimerase